METINQAIVLVGGFGTRLGEYTKTTPKPLIDVGGPFVDHVLRSVAAAGVRDLVLLASYLGDRVRQLYEGRRFGEARVRVLVEPAPLGTAGGLRQFASELDDKFYVLNGDSYFDFDLNRLSQPLLNNGKTGVLALCAVRNTRRYGRVLVESVKGVDEVTAFLEKDDDANEVGIINAGIYAFRRDVLHHIGAGSVSMEQTVLPSLVAERQLGGVQGCGYFIDIGIPDALAAARAELPDVLSRPAVFFDRDGTLNIDAGYTYRLDNLRLTEGAIDAVKRCNEAGYYVFVVTNQAGVARGYYDEAAVRAFHWAMQKEFRLAGAHLDGLYFCPHHPEGSIERYRQICSCRKPAPGLIQQALAEWPIDRAHSVLVGDKESDLQAAAACNVRSLHFRGGNLQTFLQLHGVI